ncbi:type I-E CRISPR-associated protein Cse2/CasB [Leucobacter weissii]|uniref:Type I-E CRISPR-associated protein Cse2/CasB n=1 Tax=Leucobacter weissii TaxID=1983706 RepID=A0A939S941_9MICO|nr:type I-E CRISPR-associated protein Cse2/CasB [Leucobacter weissii]MBO1900537.1 type I-E CRISPR-associated protein Cse2/CasB [Leucobacter weissii]
MTGAHDISADEVVERKTTRDELLRNSVSSKISRIQGALLGENPRTQARARAILAKLRKAASRQREFDPQAWQLVLGGTGLIAQEDDELLPAELQGSSNSASEHERAAYTAIVTYAIHQQSQQKRMHQPGKRFATAVGELVRDTTPSVKTRFDSLANAKEADATAYHLRSLVTLLRSAEIGFDYGLLAVDLKRLSHARTRQRVLIRWSRDFVNGYQPRKPEASDSAA